jgi:hypothetical protein
MSRMANLTLIKERDIEMAACCSRGAHSSFARSVRTMNALLNGGAAHEPSFFGICPAAEPSRLVGHHYLLHRHQRSLLIHIVAVC